MSHQNDVMPFLPSGKSIEGIDQNHPGVLDEKREGREDCVGLKSIMAFYWSIPFLFFHQRREFV